MRTIEIKGIRVHVPALIVGVVGVVIAVAVAPDAFVGVPTLGDPQNPAEAWAAVSRTFVWAVAFFAPLWVLTLYLNIREGDEE